MKAIRVIIGSLVALWAGASPLLAADSAGVDIPDPSLRSVIRTTLRKAGDITAADLEKLTALDASRNKLGYAPPIQSLEGLQWARNLRSLHLTGLRNRLTYLKPADEDLVDVEPPSPTPPPPSAALLTTDLSPLAGLTSLQSINLAGNGLTNLVVPGGLTNLQELDLAVNFQPELDSLPNPQNLRRLGLRYCAVTNTSFLRALTNLRSLDLSYNYLPDFSVPAELIQIEELKLDQMDLTNFVVDAAITRLQSLSLPYNGLTNAAFLGDFPGLRELDLSYNAVADFDFLKVLTALQRLELAGCPVMQASEFFNAWHTLIQLRELNLSNTGIHRLEVPASLQLLEVLIADYNRLTSVTLPSAVSGLKVLSLGGCALPGLALPITITNLRSLNLAGNCMTNFVLPSTLTGLEEMWLGFNRLVGLELPAGLASLRSVNLNNNQLPSFRLPDGASTVEWLNLSSNPLVTVDLSASRKSLIHLNISFTRIMDLNFLSGFEQLQSFTFYDNLPASIVLPDGLRRLRVLGLHDWCPNGAKCLSAPQNPLSGVELPASIDTARLIVSGFSRNLIRIRGLSMLAPVLLDDGQVGLRINGAPGRSVQVQTSANLMNWSNWQRVVLGATGAELTNGMSSPLPQFFRVIGAEP